ncbi:YraN family protein [Gordonia sp. CPCC 205333]|uniref:YraN family protein n=1 Tax=Gordonia sp. CPCC 205333 TaxID=3140790 RepID=UPI003AF36794
MGSSQRPKPNRRGQIGQLGEEIAAAQCKELGWTVLERNWRNRYGELDIIAADGAGLIVVEVKTRSTDKFGDAAQAVTAAKLSRMRKLTRMWLAAQDRHWTSIRFDVIAVQLNLSAPPDGHPVEIRHHRGVYV